MTDAEKLPFPSFVPLSEASEGADMGRPPPGSARLWSAVIATAAQTAATSPSRITRAATGPVASIPAVAYHGLKRRRDHIEIPVRQDEVERDLTKTVGLSDALLV